MALGINIGSNSESTQSGWGSAMGISTFWRNVYFSNWGIIIFYLHGCPDYHFNN
jgi:hypothetical protein